MAPASSGPTFKTVLWRFRTEPHPDKQCTGSITLKHSFHIHITVLTCRLESVLLKFANVSFKDYKAANSLHMFVDIIILYFAIYNAEFTLAHAHLIISWIWRLIWYDHNFMPFRLLNAVCNIAKSKQLEI